MAAKIEYYTAVDDTALHTNATLTDIGNGFTLGTTGANLNSDLSSATLKMYRLGSPGTGTVSIYEVGPSGLPLGSAVSTGTFNADGLSTTNSTATPWTDVTMSSFTLEVSRQYVFAVSVSAGGAADYVGLRGVAGVGYTGGNKTTRISGVWQNTDENVDFVFAINGGEYAGTLCTLGEAIAKAGANANASSKNEVLVSSFVRQAEGLINSTTRFDWVTAYSGLTDEVKFLLNRTASAIAAIDIITYDMSSYTTETAEAETMINVYREELLMGLSLLRDQKVKTFITGDT